MFLVKFLTLNQPGPLPNQPSHQHSLEFANLIINLAKAGLHLGKLGKGVDTTIDRLVQYLPIVFLDYQATDKGYNNISFPVAVLEDKEILALKAIWSKPRPNTYQVLSRLQFGRQEIHDSYYLKSEMTNSGHQTVSFYHSKLMMTG